MAYVHIKSDERREYEAQVAASFGVTRPTAAQAEMAETIAAKTVEVCKENHVKGGY